MALDRQSIEKRDFPIGRRGYEPESVDAHLANLAAEVDAMQRTAARRGGDSSLASTASAQVQAIVEAAEASAADIEREAREEAAQIRQDAGRDAQRTREEAIQRSQEHVGKVSEATSLMLQRVDAMESELSALVESLRTGANRLNADLSLLEGNMGDLYTAAGRPSGGEMLVEEEVVVSETVIAAVPPELLADAVDAPLTDEELAAHGGVEVEITAVDVDLAPDPEPEPEPEAEVPAAGPADAAGDADVEGARLVALNMALNGQSREETDAYLADNFDLADRAALLDEVYSTVES